LTFVLRVEKDPTPPPGVDPIQVITISCIDHGVFDATIDWGDGTTGAVIAFDDPNLSHQYAAEGDYEVTIQGTFPNVYFYGNISARNALISVRGAHTWMLLSSAFRGCSHLESLDVASWDTEEVTDFSNFIAYDTALTEIDISRLDLSQMSSSYRFARGCSALSTIIVGNAFDNTPCVNFSRAFKECALDEASVNGILESINRAGTSGGELGINFGTSAAPTGDGLTAKNELIARGWTVETN
jgi:surface protein